MFKLLRALCIHTIWSRTETFTVSPVFLLWQNQGQLELQKNTIIESPRLEERRVSKWGTVFVLLSFSSLLQKRSLSEDLLVPHVRDIAKICARTYYVAAIAKDGSVFSLSHAVVPVGRQKYADIVAISTHVSDAVFAILRVKTFYNRGLRFCVKERLVWREKCCLSLLHFLQNFRSVSFEIWT